MKDPYMIKECCQVSAQRSTWWLSEAAKWSSWNKSVFVIIANGVKLSSLHEVSCKAHFEQIKSAINKTPEQYLNTIFSPPGNAERQSWSKVTFSWAWHHLKRSKKRSGSDSPEISQSCVPVFGLSKENPQIKPPWPQRFSVIQLSFTSHQDRICCTRDPNPVSKASCTAGFHLHMALFSCYAKCLVPDVETVNWEQSCRVPQQTC